MSTSSSQIQQANQALEGKPEWLEQFLRRTFFNTCSIHDLSRNELNRYCIDCDASACRYCMSSGSHFDHNILKVYRHAYKDVISLTDMEKQMDCSQIQAYKCNMHLVIALNPLPHCGSGSTTFRESSCVICMRRIMDPTLNRYCSIACKVEAFARKKNNLEPPFLSIRRSSADKEEKMELLEEKERKRKRKGIPHKAPK